MNTQISGHMQVSRSLTVAGRAHIEGAAKINGNLRVDGWLDARNIKSPCKGLFASVDALTDRYPEPHDGWWALVGDSIPAEVYRAEAGVWTDTGSQGGETVVDLNHYDDAIDQATGAIESLKDQVDSITHPVGVTDGDCDFGICDAEGNDIVRFTDGHIRTRNFDSADINAHSTDHPVAVAQTTMCDYAVCDPDGNDILRVADGHIITRNFNSAAVGTVVVNDIVANNSDAIERSVLPVFADTDLCLLCFNDIHGDRANLARLLQWREQYMTMIDDTLCIGDMCNVNSAESFAWFNDPRIMTVIGNHDIYTSGTSGDLGESGCYNRYMTGISSWGVQYTAGKCYYYKDYSKVRLIVIDCMHWSGTQADWLTATLTSARAADKSVLIASHYPIGQWDAIDCPFSCRDPFTSYYSLTATASAVRGFINDGGKFVAYLCGHTHNDVVGTLRSDSNQLMLTFDSATPRPENVEVHTPGTHTQDSFTLVGIDTRRSLLMLYRVGGTADRYLRSKRILTINYSTKQLINNL